MWVSIFVDFKIHNVKQNRVGVEVVRYGQCSETSGCNFFGDYANL